MQFRTEHQIDAPRDLVEAAMVDPRYVAATADLPKLGAPQLLDQDHDGDRVHQRIRYRFTGGLSSAVTKVIDRDKLTWVDDARCDLGSHRCRHTIEPDHYAELLHAAFDVVLVATAERTHRTIDGDVRVRMPLVGGKVERALVSGLQEHAEAEAHLLARWIGEHAS